MTRRRPLPGFSVSTKGHSVLRKYAYGSPPTSRRYGSYGYEHTDVSPVRNRYNSREEDYITSAVQRATSIGSDALYDTLDTAHMSRNRDYDLLQHTNAAIVNTETHSSPKAAVASLRARSRPQTQPRSARNFSPRHQAYHEVAYRASSAPPLGHPVVVFAEPRQSWVRGSPRSLSVSRSRSVDRDSGAYNYMRMFPTAPSAIREALDSTRRRSPDEKLNYLTTKYNRSIRNSQRALSPYDDYESDNESSTRYGRYYISPATARSKYNYPRQSRMLDYYSSPLTARRPFRRFRRSLAVSSERPGIPYYELTYNPRYQNEVARLLESLERPRSHKRKSRSLYAAIVASKLEDEPGKRHRRTPRSKYAADKYRSTHKVGENPLYYSEPATAGLTASRGTVQRTTDRKAVRDAEGNFTKPRNILSWQYRLESRVPPEEIMYQPSTFNRMRERLHEAQDKMDRHRQLLDRYIPEEGTSESIESRVNRKLNELEQRDTSYRSGGGRQSVGSYTPLDYYRY